MPQIRSKRSKSCKRKGRNISIQLPKQFLLHIRETIISYAQRPLWKCKNVCWTLLRILAVMTQARKSWKQISDTPRSNNAEKGKMKNGLIALINGSFFLCVWVLRKGKRKPASQDRNGYLRRGLWVQALHRCTENRAPDPSGCIAITLLHLPQA